MGCAPSQTRGAVASSATRCPFVIAGDPRAKLSPRCRRRSREGDAAWPQLPAGCPAPHVASGSSVGPVLCVGQADANTASPGRLQGRAPGPTQAHGRTSLLLLLLSVSGGEEPQRQRPRCSEDTAQERPAGLSSTGCRCPSFILCGVGSKARALETQGDASTASLHVWPNISRNLSAPPFLKQSLTM